MARSFLIAALALAIAWPAVAQVSAFDGVWQVDPRGRSPGGPHGSGGPGGPGGPPTPPQTDGGGPPLPENLASMLDRGDKRIYGQMTPAGRAMFATFDPKVLPANNCKSPGLPSIAMTPNLQAWRVSGGKLTIHHEYFDTHREIALDSAAPMTGPHTALGYAIGKLSGDTVTIETTGLAPAWGGLARNAPSSDARIVRETYRLDGPDTLRGQIEIEDAKYLNHPLRLSVTLHRAKAATEIVTFPCDLEASRRDAGG